jgi:hypothetical protein
MIISNIIASVSITDCQNDIFHVDYPGLGNEYLYFSTSSDFESKLDYQIEARKIGERHRDITCKYPQVGHDNSIEHVIIVEMFYQSHQLLGVPLLSNPLTDPIPIYSKAVMRKVISRNNIN